GLGLDHRVLDRREGDLAAAELQARDADAPAARVAALGDRAVIVELDPGLQLVGLAEEIVLLHRAEVEQPAVRRLVVVGDAPLERQLRHAFDRLGPGPGDRGDGRLAAHPPPTLIRAAGPGKPKDYDSLSRCRRQKLRAPTAAAIPTAQSGLFG